ncbi:hypothetical protein [Lysobacter gummosus]|uniref:hypothetical protein n=1 Tax=Lysobacter gummosus TaxID=262324 RepID=UPI00363EFD47
MTQVANRRRRGVAWFIDVNSTRVVLFSDSQKREPVEPSRPDHPAMATERPLDV